MAFNRSSPPKGIKKIYCSQFDCINLIAANGDHHTIECAAFNEDGCTFISRSVFYKPSRYEHVPVQVKYLNVEGAKFLYEIQIANQFYDFDFFKRKYTKEKRNSYINLGFYTVVYLLGYFCLRRTFLDLAKSSS